MRGVETDAGRPSSARSSSNAGGIYAHEIGAHGRRARAARCDGAPVRDHQAERPPADMPTLRDPSLLVYFRGESGGLVDGRLRAQPGAVGSRRHRRPTSTPPPRAGLGPLRAALRGRDSSRPDTRRRGDRDSSSTAPRHSRPTASSSSAPSRVAGFWVAAGFCAHGIAGSGGMGRLMAEWIIEGQPSLDAWEMDSRRSGRSTAAATTRSSAPTEVYATYYDVKYPGHERHGRPAAHGSRRSTRGSSASAPPSARSRAGSGSTGSRRNEAAGDESLRPDGWAGRMWSPAIGAEHRACREAAALFDETSFAKLEVVGPGAAVFLEHLCANRVARPTGHDHLHPAVQPAGGVECDLTVTRLGEDRFRIVTGTAIGNHDLAWIRSHVPGDGSVYVEDVTSRYACFALWGPNSRAILQPLTDTDSRQSRVPLPASAGALRRGCPVPRTPRDLRRRARMGAVLPLRVRSPLMGHARRWPAAATAWYPAGTRRSSRCGSRRATAFGAATSTSADTPFEAGLGFSVKMDKDVPFIGRDALLAAGTPTRRLACLVLDDPRTVVLGSEPVRVDGRAVGRVTSGGYGYTVERSIAYAYVPAADVEPGRRVEVGIFGRFVGGEVVAEPLFDPENARARAPDPALSSAAPSRASDRDPCPPTGLRSARRARSRSRRSRRRARRWRAARRPTSPPGAPRRAS